VKVGVTYDATESNQLPNQLPDFVFTDEKAGSSVARAWCVCGVRRINDEQMEAMSVGQSIHFLRMGSACFVFSF